MGVQVCEQAGSPHVKLLYDICHMQVVEGDLIRTIQAHQRQFCHYHVAGSPGRHDSEERQEIAYPAVMSAIRATGYDGYVGHEFLPRGNPVAALEQAYEAYTL